jgi:uncharacterized protein (TIGR02118 family)
MIKAITCINRKPGMEVEAFQEYWRTRHAEIVSELPDVRRYVQSHALLQGYRKGGLIHDGIAELWFDDIEVMRGLADSKEYAAVAADEANFIDTERTVFLLTEDHVIKDEPIPEDGVKNIEFIHRRPGMEVEAFQRYWREVHGPTAAKIPVLRRYVQSHVRLGGYRSGRQPVYDGIPLTWFDSTADMRFSATTEEYKATMADEPNFLAEEEIPILITKEHVIID